MTGQCGELAEFAYNVLMDPQTYKWMDLGAVPRSVANKLRKLGIKEPEKMKFVLESHDIVHAYARHSNQTTRLR